MDGVPAGSPGVFGVPEEFWTSEYRVAVLMDFDGILEVRSLTAGGLVWERRRGFAGVSLTSSLRS